jgi:diguanylate cyclase (GGDEF)-like protein/PAS domain S-box-containing protein
MPKEILERRQAPPRAHRQPPVQSALYREAHAVMPTLKDGLPSAARDLIEGLGAAAMPIANAAVAALYFFAAQFGFELAFTTKQVTAVWPPTGIAAVAYLMFGWRVLPGVFIGALWSNAVRAEPLLTALGIALGNAAAGMVGIAVMHRFLSFRPRIDTVSSVLGWTVVVAAGGSLVSASNGVVQLALGGIIPWTAAASVWWVWWTGDTMGVLLLGPLLLTLIWPTPVQRTARQWTEITLLFVALVVLCDVTFTRQLMEIDSSVGLKYAVFPFVIWFALRCTQREVAIAIVLICGFAVWSAIHDNQQFSLGTLEQRLIQLELFMAATAMTGLILASVTAERRSAQWALKKANEDLERRVDQRTKELAEERELLRVTLESIGDAVITTDRAGRVQWMNPVAERLTGRSYADGYDEPLEDVFHIVDEDSRARSGNPVGICLNRHEVVSAAKNSILISRSGDEFGIEASAAPIRDARGNVLGAILVFHDVSEQRRLNREMRFRASHDELTSLVNRGEFEIRLRRALAKVRSSDDEYCLLFIDLDEFKLVNDACGHVVGDEFLRQVTSLLKNCVRARDTLARLGGDEFGVILEHCSATRAQHVAQQICDQMEEFRFVHDGRRFRVGASIGLVALDERWSNTEDLLHAADTSCTAAKEAGRNRVHVWTETSGATTVRRRQARWASRLEQALDEDRFVLYGQRIVPVARRSAGLHFEVLLRLLDSDGVTTIAAGAFLPAAERFHMATRIDRLVVRKIFEWMEAAGAMLDDVELVAVNLSGQSVTDRAFHRDVAGWIASASFDVRKLCFEITETAAVTRLGDAAAFIVEMRELGVRIALDDFGAGASSFGYLKMLPVDFLKIDGQFIRDLVDDPLDGAAVRCFRDVAKVIGVQTVAEFVERPQTLDALREIGIDFAQGYLIHKPEPLVVFAEELTLQSVRNSANG